MIPELVEVLFGGLAPHDAGILHEDVDGRALAIDARDQPTDGACDPRGHRSSRENAVSAPRLRAPRRSGA